MIKIIVVGKIKEKYLREAAHEYLKRLSKYTKINIIEVMDEDFDKIKTLNKEKEKIVKYISDKDYVITLEIDGKQMNSIELSQNLEKILVNNSNITFVIGGSYGLDDEIKQRSDFALSFSKLTFPHQLFRVLLLEQLYRSFKIINNESYHK